MAHAGPRRAANWNRVENGAPPLNEEEFIARIDIPSTRAYVTSILERYRRVKSSARLLSLQPFGFQDGCPKPDSSHSLYAALFVMISKAQIEICPT